MSYLDPNKGEFREVTLENDETKYLRSDGSWAVPSVFLTTSEGL